MDRAQIIDVCQKIQVSADMHNWEKYLSAWTDIVELDYNSFFKAPLLKIPKETCVSNAKMALMKFDATMHIMTNFDVAISGETAEASCYVQALHVLKGAPGGESYTLYGKYNFGLVKIALEWKVCKMKYTHVYDEGNKELFALSVKK